MARSDKYADAEETQILCEAAQNTKTPTKEPTKKEVDSTGGKKRKDDRSRDEHRSDKRPDHKFSTYTPLNKPQEQVLMEIRGEGFVNCPELWSNPHQRSKSKYCHFHCNHGHNTSDFYNLKQEIESLIREGHLGKHVDPVARTTEERLNDNRPIEDIRTIIRGYLGGGESNNARKNHARNVGRLESEIMVLARPPKERKLEKYSVAFTEENARGIHHPHDDALVITVTIANHRVFRVLVDTGSSADVLFLQAFDKIGAERSALRPVRTPLIGFSSRQILPEGTIQLPLTTGDAPNQVTIMIDFLIVDQSLVYNVILGRPSLSLLRAISQLITYL
ncbi:uncharacterized protein LOC131226893 [Magnolia sinica]|uniref:uncharacterized protein LOC131226893 n=1 Tax=Magnolia sinica TaxID=86752 RepID=UPI002657FFAC|nr:uncharacterized protein LOC131226893 [Magnolia sinica]